MTYVRINMRKSGTHTERETNRQHSARKLQVIMFIHVYTATCNTSHIVSNNDIKKVILWPTHQHSDIYVTWRPVVSFYMFAVFNL